MSTSAPAGVPWSLVVLSLGALALVAFLYVKSPEIARKRGEAQDKREAEQRQAAEVDRCRGLREQILVSAQQGRDPNETQNLQAAYQSCIAETGIADAYRAPLVGAEAKVRQVNAEWGHYLGTSKTDGGKRGSTLGAIIRLAAGFVTDVRGALNQATTRAQVMEIRAVVVNEWLPAARDRVACFIAGQGQCSRDGINEPHNNDRARDEYLASIAPIVGAAEATRWVTPFLDAGRFPRDWAPPFKNAGPGLLSEIDAKAASLVQSWSQSNQGAAAAALRAANPNLFLVNFGLPT